MVQFQKAQYQIPEPNYEEEVRKLKLKYCKNKQKIGKGTFG